MGIYLVYFDNANKEWFDTHIEGAYKTFKEAENKFIELLDYCWVEDDMEDANGYTYEECIHTTNYRNLYGDVITIEKVKLYD